MYDTLKRCFDVVGASFFLVLLSPVFAAAALAVRLGGPGPILFRQARVGRGGKPFDILKLRTMRISQSPGPLITTGEGGMATTADPALERTIRSLSLHGMSRDAWARFRAGGSWDYAITAAGFKYNMTDLAAALGLRQLARADRFRSRRATIARRYSAALADLEEVEVPRERADRRHAWHLYPLRLRLARLATSRDEFIRTLAARGVGTSVHWRPLHMQPFYAERYGYRAEEFPVAFREWQRLVSLPIFPGLSDADVDHVVTAVRTAVAEGRKRRVAVA